jgi:hypothetical protein
VIVAAILTLAQLHDLAVRHGFADPDTAAAIAMAESGGNPAARGDLNLGVSIGLWQVNLRWHPECRDMDLTDPDVNAQCALSISRGGTHWTAWSTYNRGLHLPYLRQLQNAERDTQPDLAPSATALLEPDTEPEDA